MTKAKCLIIAIFTMIVLFLIPNISNAAVSYERSFPSNEGTIKLKFSGLTLDENKAYEFALVKQGSTPVDWFSVDDGHTATQVGITLSSGTQKIVDVLKQTDTGYIYIREKDNTTNQYVLENHKVDLKLPYLQSVNYTSSYQIKAIYGEIGKELFVGGNTYYCWQKVDTESLINKFLEIKKSNKSITELENSLPTAPDTGYTITTYASQPLKSDEKNDGLYLLWIKRTGQNCKDVYSCIVHDGLPNATTVAEYLGGQSNTVAVTSVSINPTKISLEVGKTYSLSSIISPANATNKVVTWSSSDETIVTVDNAGKITGKKVGSATITVTTQDGNKKATCTVTVIAAKDNNKDGSTTDGKNNDSNKDDTKATGKLPQTGIGMGIVVVIIITALCGGYAFIRTNKLRDI